MLCATAPVELPTRTEAVVPVLPIFTVLTLAPPTLIMPPVPAPVLAPASIVMLPPLPFVPPALPPCSTKSPPAEPVPLPPVPALIVRLRPTVEAGDVAMDSA